MEVERGRKGRGKEGGREGGWWQFQLKLIFYLFPAGDVRSYFSLRAIRKGIQNKTSYKGTVPVLIACERVIPAQLDLLT